ncbi:MAG: hypothetical protein KGL39_56470 [Patescibacteria group bacterium]|nr:hypothetical protein [Patescibacteria group bacterium]
MSRWARQPHSAVLTNKQRSIFDVAEQKKQEGINLSYRNTSTIWKDAAGEALIAVAKRTFEFTSDEVWAELASQGIHTGENRALGAVMQAGNRSGVIEFTGEYRPTTRPEGHKGPKALWRSKIYAG